MLVPAGADARIQPAMAGDIDRGGDLGVEGGVAVAVAADHLADVDVGRIPGQGGGNRPALEGGVHRRFGGGVEMVEDPDRIPAALVGHLGDVGHRLVLGDRVVDLGQIHAPALGHEDAEFGGHGGPFRNEPRNRGASAGSEAVGGLSYHWRGPLYRPLEGWCFVVVTLRPAPRRTASCWVTGLPRLGEPRACTAAGRLQCYVHYGHDGHPGRTMDNGRLIGSGRRGLVLGQRGRGGLGRQPTHDPARHRPG